MNEITKYFISGLEGVYTFIHFVLFPILGIIGAYYLLLRLYGFRTIRWSKEMEIEERKTWQEQLDNEVENIRQNMGKEEWAKYKKHHERLRQSEDHLKNKMD